LGYPETYPPKHALGKNLLRCADPGRHRTPDFCLFLTLAPRAPGVSPDYYLFLVPEDFHVARKLDRITINPAIMNGQPCIRGMRLTVRRVLEAAALYPDRNEVRRACPELEDDDIGQAFEFAALNLDDRILPLEAG
jgi:uncharacterized protein (DUF433 family)